MSRAVWLAACLVSALLATTAGNLFGQEKLPAPKAVEVIPAPVDLKRAAELNTVPVPSTISSAVNAPIRRNEPLYHEQFKDGWKALTANVVLADATDKIPLLEMLNALEELASPPEAYKDRSKLVRIYIDIAAFKLIQSEFDENRATVSLPKITASLATVLDAVAAQINGVITVRDGSIYLEPKAAYPSGESDEITRTLRLNSKFVANAANTDLPTYLELLKKIRQQGINIVIDPVTEKKLQAESANMELQNVSAVNAVRLIANMAGVELVVLDNVLYLTDEKRAATLKLQMKERAQVGTAGLKDKSAPPK